MPAVTNRAIIIPNIRKTPSSGKCQYDPNHKRAKSDAYQGIIYGIKNINDVELTNIMDQIK